VYARCFAIAALGFGVAAFAAAAGESSGVFFPEGFRGFGFVAAVTVFGAGFAGTCFALVLLAGAGFFLAFAFATGFFAPAAFGSSFFSVSSNAGFGRALSCMGTLGPMRVISAAGFTPAAAAAFAADAASAGCFGRPSISGFTMTWLS
jgi:hypothetical protein